jgi:hypothetical protein
MARNITPVSKLGGMLFQELPVLLGNYADAYFILNAVICTVNDTFKSLVVETKTKTIMGLALSLRTNLLECGVHYNDRFYIRLSGFIAAGHHESRLKN